MRLLCLMVSLVCGLAFSKPATALNVVTTTTDLAALARSIGGQHVNVQSLTKGSRDPHFAAAKPSMIRKIFNADVLLLVGAELEVGWLPVALQAGRNGKVLPGGRGYLDLSQAVTLLDIPTGPITRAMGDVHASGNPHYWLDPRRGLKIAQAISHRFAELDPKNAKSFHLSYKTFESALQKKLNGWRKSLAPLKSQKLLQYHRSFIYLAAAFDFILAGEVEPLPGIAPSARHLQKLITKIKSENMKALIIEPYYDLRGANFLRDKTGIAVVILPQSVGAMPEIKTYFDLFDGIVEAFRTAKVI